MRLEVFSFFFRKAKLPSYRSYDLIGERFWTFFDEQLNGRRFLVNSQSGEFGKAPLDVQSSDQQIRVRRRKLVGCISRSQEFVPDRELTRSFCQFDAL